MRHAPLIALAILLAPSARALAQTPGPQLPRLDVAAWVGRQGADRPDLAPAVYRTWHSAGVAGAGVGYYWTEHLKTEIDAAATGRAELFGSERIDLGRGSARYVYTTHHVSTRTLSLTQSWQFLHNAWVHPFAGAGIDVDWRERRTETRSTLTTPTVPSIDEQASPDEHDRRVRVLAALTGGMKVYLTRRGFIRTDLRVGVADGVETLRWRVGAGIDF